MRAICVDDEAILLKVLKAAVEQSPDIESAADFSNGEDAIKYAESNPVDIAFLDIEIHSMTGIELAVELRKINPKMYVVFCTGYENYALDAFRIHANGYLTKPIYAENVQEQINNIKALTGDDGSRLVVKCFGNFEIFYRNKPLEFKRSKSKELFAYLTDRQGASVSAGQITAALWEDDYDDKRVKNNLYQAYFHLKQVLDEIGLGDILIKNSSGYAINASMIDCDYYKLLKKEISLRDLPQSEYMYQYSWAEETNAKINIENS